jgi:hypothetical protein
MQDPTTPNKVKQSPMQKLVEERLTKYYKPCFDAAYLLDPISFERDGEGEWRPPVAKLSNADRKAAFEVGTWLSGARNCWAAAKTRMPAAFLFLKCISMSPVASGVRPSIVVS